MEQIEVVALGPLRPEIKLQKVVRIANKAQDHFYVYLGPRLRHLGEPDASETEYYTDTLSEKLKTARNTNTSRPHLVGIHDGPLFDELFSAIDSSGDVIIISTLANQIDELLARAKKSQVEYVLVELAAQLLTKTYRAQCGIKAGPEDCVAPWHRETRSCVFDYCDVVEHTTKKLIEPHLCGSCQSRFEEANIPDHMIGAAMQIIRAAAKPRLGGLLRNVLAEPLVTLVVGGWMGVAIGMTTGNWWTFGGITAALVLLIIAMLVAEWRRLRIVS